MDSLHTVLRSLRGETKSRRDHLSVFREFLDHLGRIGRGRAGHSPSPRAKPNGSGKPAPAKNAHHDGRR
jgi:hypothetical protein